MAAHNPVHSNALFEMLSHAKHRISAGSQTLSDRLVHKRLNSRNYIFKSNALHELQSPQFNK